MDKLARQLLDTWFSEPVSSHWFKSTDDIDQQLKTEFEAGWLMASEGRFDHWLASPESCLALIILLDQIPLNIFRGHASSFKTEQAAINASKQALEQNFDEAIEPGRRAFIYMPLMHSEHIEDQDLAVSCFEKAGLTANLRFAKHHREIIRKFGRFPHRNIILGRQSSEQERIYLDSENAFKG